MYNHVLEILHEGNASKEYIISQLDVNRDESTYVTLLQVLEGYEFIEPLYNQETREDDLYRITHLGEKFLNYFENEYPIILESVTKPTLNYLHKGTLLPHEKCNYLVRKSFLYKVVENCPYNLRIYNYKEFIDFVNNIDVKEKCYMVTLNTFTYHFSSKTIYSLCRVKFGG